MRVERLVGVYDADGTIRGELAYLFGRLRGTRHCALCDITHGAVRERADWRARRDELPVPVITVHRDEVPPALAEAIDEPPPYLAAETDAGPVVLLDATTIGACHGDPEAFVAATRAALADLDAGG